MTEMVQVLLLYVVDEVTMDGGTRLSQAIAGESAATTWFGKRLRRGRRMSMLTVATGSEAIRRPALRSPL